MPHMGYDTKTDRLTDCQSQCDFDFEFRRKTEGNQNQRNGSSAEIRSQYFQIKVLGRYY
jgi:hypothetical protein